MERAGGARLLATACRASAGTTAVVALVLVTTHLALQLPGMRFLSGFAPAALVSYDRFLGELSPLSDDYISRVLGIDPPRARAVAAQDGATAADALPPGAATLVGAAEGGQVSVQPAEEAEPVEIRHAFTNDDFAGAVHPPRLPFVGRTDTTSASRELGEPTSCAPVGGTAWYVYRATRPATLAADTFGTSYATALGVFRGRSMSSLREVGCSRGVTGNAAVSFRADAGETYWFQVTGPAGGGPLTFALAELGPTTRVSVTSQEQQAGGYHHPVAALSADGRYVAFTGVSSALGSPQCGDIHAQPRLTAWCNGLWLRDRVAGTTTLLVSTSPRRPNTQDDPLMQSRTPDRYSYLIFQPKFSADARYLSFTSDDPRMVPGDSNGSYDAFVLDRLTGRIERVSVSSQGVEGQPDLALSRADANEGSHSASLSSDGRFAVFTSTLAGLTPDDRNHVQDVFVRDRRTGRTERVSVAPGGGDFDLGATSSALQSISGDGRVVVFTSAGRPKTACADTCVNYAYVHDRRTHRSRLLSLTPRGEVGNAASDHPTVSADGRYVAFTARASDLVPGDTNGVADVFRLDLRTNRLTRVSVSSDGKQQTNPAVGAGDQAQTSQLKKPIVSLSRDGRFVAFASASGNLVAGDENNALDVFVHDARTGATSRLSVTEDGGNANGDSLNPSLSADGRSVAFVSSATNLVAQDTNGINDIFVHDSRVPGRP